MQLDDTLKGLLQLCADIQDGFWMAAAHAQRQDIAAKLQDGAVQWNAFADQIFAILLQVDHTSPDARWKANPNRSWLNHYEDIAALDDRRLCLQCLQGLDLAQTELRKASATVGHPQVRTLVDGQLQASAEQMAELQAYTANGLGKSLSRHRADTPGKDPSVQ